eukprot:jgi/Chlat1/8860/Chrsp91S08158
MLGQCRFAKARAYAVGLYVDESLAKQLHQRESNAAVDENGSDVIGDGAAIVREDKCAAVLAAPGAGKQLTLVMAHDIAGHHIAKGFDRSLLPRVRAAQGNQKKGPAKNALKEFTTVFNKIKLLRKGTRVTLHWMPGGSLGVLIDASCRAVIQSPQLCWAVFDTYLGPDSVFARYKNTSFVFVDGSTASAA